MSSLAALEQELAQKEEDVKTCNDMLAISPNDADALATIPILETEIEVLKSKIAAKKAEQDAAAPPPPPGDDIPPPPPKYDMSKHPKFQQASSDTPPPPPEEKQAVFNVRDLVMAKFSEDKQWYQATITSKTGSAHDPVYHVTFKGYGNSETKRKHEVRAIENKKRKADGPPATSTQLQQQQTSAVPKPTPNGQVISAAPSVDTTLVKKREPSKVSDGPTRLPPEPKKMKSKKHLDGVKSSWQSWQNNAPKGMKKQKDSQFRTAEFPNAKVGVTGSGKPMQQDPKLKAWKYDADEPEE